MKKIPSLNLQDFLSKDQQKKSNFVKSIGSAFQDIGFCAVHGHFLDDDLVSRLYEQIIFRSKRLCFIWKRKCQRK